jgi:hypothetical protein
MPRVVPVVLLYSDDLGLAFDFSFYVRKVLYFTKIWENYISLDDLTGLKIAKDYLEDCGIWLMPPMVHFFIKSGDACSQ